MRAPRTAGMLLTRIVLRPLWVLLVLATLAAALAPTSAIAQASSEPTVESFFEVAPGDRASAFMAELFGPSVWQAATFRDAERSTTLNLGGDGGMLGLMSSVLSVACMFLTVLIITWGAVSANLQGAIEGVQAGRRYSMLWVPLRSVFSFGMLLPVVSGYCLIQVIMMWLIHLSIGIANSGYNLVLDNFYSGKPSIPIYVNGAKETAGNVFLIEVCRQGIVDDQGQSLVFARSDVEQTTNWKNVTKNIGSAVLIGVDQPLFDGGGKTFSATTVYDTRAGSGHEGGICGSEIIRQSAPGFTGEGAVGDAAIALFEARQAALTALHAEMGAVAAAVKVAVTQAQPGAPPSTYDAAAPEKHVMGEIYPAYHAAYVKYREALVAASSQAAQVLITRQPERYIDKAGGQGAGEATSVVQDEIRKGGWVMLGALYWNMQALNRSIANVVNKQGDVTVLPPDFRRIAENGAVDSQLINDMTNASGRMLDLALSDLDARDNEDGLKEFVGNYGAAPSSGIGIFSAWSLISDQFNVDSISQSFTKMITEDGDFVYGLMGLGEICWNVGTGMLLAGLVTSTAGEVGQAVLPGEEGGKGLSSKLPTGRIAALIAAVGGFLVAMAVPLILVGFALAFYLPAVPMILWIINLVGWMMQSVKAVMAVPIWAAAHSIPEGEGIAGTHAKQGYMLVIGIVLRPLLLLTGLLLGAVILQVVGWMMRFMLPLMLASLDMNSPPAFMGFLALIAIVTGLMIAVALKCFSLSHELADEILNWAGGHGTQLGDENTSSRTQTMVSGALAGSAGVGTVAKAINSGSRAYAGTRAALAAGRNPPTAADRASHNPTT